MTRTTQANIEKKRRRYQEAYAVEALSLADLKARHVELDEEREAIERELVRTKNRDEELRALDAEEAETRARIEAGYGDLNDATPEKRRELYEGLHLRVEVGPEKLPRISGIFPVGRYGDRVDTLVTTPDQRGYVLTTSKNLTDDPPADGPRHTVYAKDSSGHSVSQKVTSSGSGRTS